MASKPLISKIVLIGATGVGKTSVLLRHNGRPFVQISPTIGASFCKSEIDVNGTIVQLQIWDTAGQERFRAMAPMYYRNAYGAIAFYDISNKESFNQLNSWVRELNDNVDQLLVLCIVGNKCDLIDQREVPTDVGLDYANSVGALFYETSALSNKGIEETFHALATRLLQHQQFVNESHASTISVESAAGCRKGCC